MMQQLNTLCLNKNPGSWQFPHCVVRYQVCKALQTALRWSWSLVYSQMDWKCCCQVKHQIFFWLLIHNRLNTIYNSSWEKGLLYSWLYMCYVRHAFHWDQRLPLLSLSIRSDLLVLFMSHPGRYTWRHTGWNWSAQPFAACSFITEDYHRNHTGYTEYS